MNTLNWNYIGAFLLELLPIIWVFLYSLIIIFGLIKKEFLIVYFLKLNCFIIFLLNLFLFTRNTIHYHTLSWNLNISFGHWFNVEGMGTKLELSYNFESFIFINLMVFLTVTIARFSRTYLHKEHGFYRFFLLIGIFMASFNTVVLANNLDLVFVAWELIGLTSALLIAFYNFREQTVRNSFWAVISYRLSDVFFIVALAFAHIMFHTTNISQLVIFASQPAFHQKMLIFCLLLIVGGLAKGAQFPFISWPMRAMEGPTSSSALYYGALSVSLGPILLIKNFLLFQDLLMVRVFIGAVALITAPMALIISKVRSDMKSTLAYSSIFHISIICLEIALGLKWLAIFHLVSNAFIRIDQFLSSLNVIQDFYENPLFFPGAKLNISNSDKNFQSSRFQKKIYHLAVNGFGFDWFIQNKVIGRWLSVLYIIESAEDKFVKLDPMIKDHQDENLNQENLWNLS